MYKGQYNVHGNQGTGSFYRPCCEHENEESENENKIDVSTNITIEQCSTATGGDGGDSKALGGDAAQASGGLVNVAINEIEADIEIPINPPIGDLKKEEAAVEPAQNETGGNVVGGAAASTGGEGGDAVSFNYAQVDVENIIVISSNGTGPDTAFTLGTNKRNYDIKVNKDGETFVNGQKMDEQELDDGTKVFILRKNNTKKS